MNSNERHKIKDEDFGKLFNKVGDKINLSVNEGWDKNKVTVFHLVYLIFLQFIHFNNFELIIFNLFKFFLVIKIIVN